MLFKRRKPDGWLEKTRTFLWPRRSFLRSARYFGKRVLRLRASPHAIAAGVAAGVFSSFLPFLGFHILLAAVIAYFLAGNILASAIGTAVGNPLTFPLMWGACYELGRLILHGGVPTDVAPLNIGHALRNLEIGQLWEPLLWPMTVGALPIGLAAGLVAYGLTRWGVVVFRDQRQKRLDAKGSLGKVTGGAAVGG